MLAPREIASAEGITSVSLSKDATRVTYAIGSCYKPENGPKTSAIWIADISQQHSARRITSASNLDLSPSFSPVDDEIYFLSDRHSGPDGPTHIYKISGATDANAAPHAVAPFDKSETVSSYTLSPDGSHIAFISTKKPDNKDEEERVEIWKQKKNLGSLRVVSLSSSEQPKSVRTLVSTESHIASFTWSSDSTLIAYRLQSSSDEDSKCFPVTEALVYLDSGETRTIYEHPLSPSSTSVLTSGLSTITYLQGLNPEVFSSAGALHINKYGERRSTLYGETEDAMSMVNIHHRDQVAVEIWSGLDRRIDVVDVRTREILFTLIHIKEEHMGCWDVRFDPTDENYVVVAVRSSAVTGEAPDLWASKTEKGTQGSLTGIRLSDHHSSWFKMEKVATSRSFQWTSVDGQAVQGVISHPRGIQELKSLPAVVVPHGGPYWADQFGLYWHFLEWRMFLASNGYVVLSPNYRGSAGRGDRFAQTHGAVGALDWEDTHTMILEAIKLGLVDATRLGIAGYSQGGFLTAWGCTRPPNNEYEFRVGVNGAGVTDWGAMTATSDLPDIADLGGGAPWIPGEPKYLKASPIRDVCNVRCPMLLLHGKQDARVPLSQAVGFARGIERMSKAPKPELIIYPREDHIFKEQKHIEDLLTRLLAFLDKYLK